VPELARYLLAESLSAQLVSESPSGFSRIVARSPDWPDWLRLLLLHPLALAADQDIPIPREPLEELQKHSDPMIRLWATYVQAIDPTPTGLKYLLREESDGTPERDLEALLAKVRYSPVSIRARLLFDVLVWQRTHHPEAARIWQGWEVRRGKLVETGPHGSRSGS
jgi:hypothetical protein